MAEQTLPPPLPSELPVLPLRRTVAFPLTLQPLAVNRPVSIETVHRALGADRLVLLLLQDNETDDPAPSDLRSVGTAAVIRQMSKSGSGVNIIVESDSRARSEQRKAPVDSRGPEGVAGVLREPGRLERRVPARRQAHRNGRREDSGQNDAAPAHARP
jgi:ATP-dependent Lon protease